MEAKQEGKGGQSQAFSHTWLGQNKSENQNLYSGFFKRIHWSGGQEIGHEVLLWGWAAAFPQELPLLITQKVAPAATAGDDDGRRLRRALSLGVSSKSGCAMGVQH